MFTYGRGIFSYRLAGVRVYLGIRAIALLLHCDGSDERVEFQCVNELAEEVEGPEFLVTGFEVGGT